MVSLTEQLNRGLQEYLSNYFYFCPTELLRLPAVLVCYQEENTADTEKSMQTL